MDKIRMGNGKAELTTVAGGKLWLMMKGKNLVIKDEMGACQWSESKMFFKVMESST